jgi:ankyrin repeat protein
MESGADVSEKNNSGWTAMSLAVKMRHLDVIKALEEDSTLAQIPGLYTVRSL